MKIVNLMEIFDAINEQTNTDMEITHKNIVNELCHKCKNFINVEKLACCMICSVSVYKNQIIDY